MIILNTNFAVMSVLRLSKRLRMNLYNSPQYQDIKPLRTNNSTSTIFLVEGVPADHRATDIRR